MQELKHFIHDLMEEGEVHKKRMIKREALTTAGNVARDFDLAKHFQLKPIQLELFKNYFASGYLIKKNSSPSAGRGQPSDEQTSTQMVIYELLLHAQQQADHLKQDAHNFAEERAKARGIEDAETITANASDLLVYEGSPDAIQRAAHKLSSIYVEKSPLPHEEFRKALLQTRDSIQLRNH